MRTDLITELVVMSAQTQTALDPVPRGKISATNQMMSFQVTRTAADSTATDQRRVMLDIIERDND
jgi:hypothetical protein